MKPKDNPQERETELREKSINKNFELFNTTNDLKMFYTSTNSVRAYVIELTASKRITKERGGGKNSGGFRIKETADTNSKPKTFENCVNLTTRLD